MSALMLTGNDLVRALTAAATTNAVDGAVRRRAEDMARTVEAETGVTAEVALRGAGDYAVTLAGQGLFARAFGSVDTPADPAIAEMMRRAGR